MRIIFEWGEADEAEVTARRRRMLHAWVRVSCETSVSNDDKMRSAGEWSLVGQRTLIETPWLSLHAENHRSADGSSFDDYLTLEEPDGVNIVAVTEENELLLVSQYRPAVGRIVFDFPAGLIEDGDGEPLDSARRELLEETGYAAETWLSTGRVEPAPHRLRKTEHCFVALGVRKVGEPILDEYEQVALVAVGIDELDRMIDQGEFACGVCLSSLALAQRKAPHAFTRPQLR